MKVLVTGAGGFVGSYLLASLSSAGHEICGTFLENEFSQRQFPALPQGVVAEALDICNVAEVRQVVEKFQPDAIIHLAGISFVPEAEKDLWRTLAVNVAGTGNVLRAAEYLARDLGKKVKFLFVSSGDVYGAVAQDLLPISEKLTPQPRNFYALSKLQAEQLVQLSERRCEGLSTVIFRSFNHIGPGQSEQFVVSNFAKQLAEISLGQREPVLAVGNLAARRDFCDVRDVVRAYVLGVERGSGVFNICSGNAVSIQTIVDDLIACSGMEVEIRLDPERMRPSDTPELRGSHALAHSELGWEPHLDVQQSLQDIFQDWVTRLSR